MEQSTSSRFALIVHHFSTSLCNQLKLVLEVQGLQVHFEIRTGLIWYRLETLNMLHGVTPACENVTYVDLFDEIFCTRGKLQREVGHLRICVVVVMRQIHNMKNLLRSHTRGKLQREVGHLRICVVVVMHQIHNMKKLAPFASISLFKALIGTLVETLGSEPVFVWCNFILPDSGGSYRTEMKAR